MSDDLPEFREGQTVAIGGEHYTVESIDPLRDGIRAYYLDGPRDETVRLEPNPRRGTFGFIRVAELEPSDVVGVEEDA